LPHQIIDFANGTVNGVYRYVGDRVIKAEFGGRVHMIKFSQDYKSFTSVRQDDLYLVNGYII
jgi:hypothetical protein